MAGVFLRDWKKGDVVSAADLNDLVEAVALLENASSGVAQVSARPGARLHEYDAPVEWPWQVLLQYGPAGPELWVVPGCVLTGGCAPLAGENGEERGGWQYETMPGNLVKVPGFDASLADPQVVYLVLNGEVRTRRILRGEVDAEAAEPAEENGEQYTEVLNASLSLVCVPVETTMLEGPLRVWPLAIYTPGAEQPVNQLQWGELSAVECRGVCDDYGDVVWPTNRSRAAAWGAAGHEAGMAVLTVADFSTERETITGPLYGTMDMDGALEFYLGVHEAPGYEGPTLPAPGDEDGDGDDFDADGDGDEDSDNDSNPDDDDDETTDDKKIAVKIGYEKGEGFASCDLVRRAGGYYWKLVLDTEYVRSVLQSVDVPATMKLAAGGSQQGSIAEVQMSLGESTASGSGTAAMGSGELLFKGTQGSYGVAARTHKFNYKISLDVDIPKKTWYLSPKNLSTAGSWVKLTSSRGASNFNVRASEWWMWSVNRAALQKAAANQLRQELSKRTLSATDVSRSADSTVTGELSGTPVAILAKAELSD